MIDTLIIGGGIAGLSAAAKLSPHGSTTLLEAETATGYHASGRSAAVFLKDYGNAQVRLLAQPRLRSRASTHKHLEKPYNPDGRQSVATRPIPSRAARLPNVRNIHIRRSHTLPDP